jgi:hypothetical protein
MKTRPVAWAGALVLLLSFILVFFLSEGVSSRPGKADRKGVPEKKKLSLRGFPRAAWRESFPGKIEGLHLARKSGDVLVHTHKRVWYYDSSGKILWKQGEDRGWKYIAGSGVSDDGQRILFQVNLEPKVATNLLELDVYYLDQEGHLLWVKDNPYRYNSSQLSPSGHYILFGDPLEKLLKVHDQNLNPLWQKDLYLWYISFDPKEHFLFDAVEGLLFNLEGRQVWDVGGFSRILSVSDDAEVILTQRFLGRESTQDMYLVARTALKKVVFSGLGGCVSPDGSLLALVGPDGNLKVYRTQEVLTADIKELPPLFQCPFLRPSLLNFSRDNTTLLVFGKENQFQTRLMLVGLSENKVLWKEGLEDTIKPPLVTEDNRLILIKRDPTTIDMLIAY